MKITVTKTVTVQEKVDFKDLQVVRGSSKDIDSINLEIFYKEIEIGYGHLNNRTNFAHVFINEGLFKEEDECDLIDYLVDSIEARSITLF